MDDAVRAQCRAFQPLARLALHSSEDWWVQQAETDYIVFAINGRWCWDQDFFAIPSSFWNFFFFNIFRLAERTEESVTCQHGRGGVRDRCRQMKAERQVLADGQAWACVKRSWIVDKWTAYERPGEAVMDGGQMDDIHQLKVTSAACEAAGVKVSRERVHWDVIELV